MALRFRDYTIIKLVQETQYRGDVRYGASLGIQCSCMSLVSVIWTLFKSPGLWDKYDLDSILDKGDQLFKLIGKFRYFGMKNLPQEFSIENYSINVEFLENNIGKITAGTYVLSIIEIRNSVRQTGACTLLFVNNYVLGNNTSI